MATEPKKSRREPKTARATISFPTEVYGELEKIAEAKKVSIAWVVREAAEKYIADQWPLFGKVGQQGR
ncbi:MAG: CopG family transcriptional regulator [Gammaproteobacteria bacterium]